MPSNKELMDQFTTIMRDNPEFSEEQLMSALLNFCPKKYYDRKKRPKSFYVTAVNVFMADVRKLREWNAAITPLTQFTYGKK